jgi:AraC-like DNA-binding protein
LAIAVGKRSELLQRLTRVRDRIAADPDLDLAVLATVCELTPHHLLRAFRARFGETPHAFATRLRIERAKACLRMGQSVTDTCFDVGFSSLGSFSTLFKQHVGVAPSAYRATLVRWMPSIALVHAAAAPFCFVSAWLPDAAQIATSEKPLPFRP